MNTELRTYIESHVAHGTSLTDIRATLVAGGWDAAEVDAACTALGLLEAAPQSTTQVTGQTSASDTVLSDPTSGNSKLPTLLAIGFVTALILGGGVAYYLTAVSSLFDRLPYSEDTLVSGIVDSISRMETFTYSASGRLLVEDRDADAAPFTYAGTADRQVYLEQYARDLERVEFLRTVLGKLSYAESYPSVLTDEIDGEPFLSSYYGGVLSNLDPLTGLPYKYTVTDNNFTLEVMFETPDVIDAIEDRWGFDPATTIINRGSKQVVFTKDSPEYVYLRREPPKPFYEEFNQAMVYLPPEMYFSVDVAARSDYADSEADWEISLDVEGDFGDLIYRVAGDVSHIGPDFYFRIRNLPSLFMGGFAYDKGEWYRVTEDWLENDEFDADFLSPRAFLPDQEDEEEYKEFREELGDFLQAVITIADEEQVLVVKNEPAKEEKDGRNLYRYDLGFSRDNLLPFVERVVAEAQKYEATRDWDLANDTALVEYLKTDEFDVIFDYYDKNTFLTFWINQEGFIELVEYSIRAVPPDEATSLRDKQAKLTFSFGFTDINEPITIEPPATSRDIEELVEENEQLLGLYGITGARQQARDASAKTSLNSMRNVAEVYYSENGFTYDGVCNDETATQLLEAAQEQVGGETDDITLDTTPTADNAACLSGDNWYVAQIPLHDTDTYYCVDSTGFAGTAVDALAASSQSCSQ